MSLPQTALREVPEGPRREAPDAEGLELAPPAKPEERAVDASLARDEWPDSARLAEAAVRDAFGEEQVERQFSLRELFVLVTVCAILALPLRLMPRAAFAGLIGGLTVVLMFLQTFFQPRTALLYYGWWLLLGLYLIACGLAVAGM
jgi:hypothetical protein